VSNLTGFDGFFPPFVITDYSLDGLKVVGSTNNLLSQIGHNDHQASKKDEMMMETVVVLALSSLFLAAARHFEKADEGQE